MDTFWWLSFADSSLPEGEQFLGVALVRVTDKIIDFIDHLDPSDGIELLRGRGQEEDVPFYTAVHWASFVGINPGGEVKGWEFPEGKASEIPPEMWHRLLSKEELEPYL